MKNLNLVILLSSLLLSACGMVGENEAPAPVIKFDAKPADCAFPKEFKSEANVLLAVDCLQKNLDNAFDSLQGEQDDELSMAELKKLQEDGLLDFAVGDSKQWDGISGALSLIHPEGKHAISRAEIQRFLVWVRTKASFLAKLANIDQHKSKTAPVQYALFQEMVEVGSELLGFLSDKGEISLDQAQAILSFVQSNAEQVNADKVWPKLRAAWTIKALLLQSTKPDDNIVGASLKAFLNVGLQIARQTDKTYHWWDTDFHPSYTPGNIESEWQNALDIAKAYFQTTPMYDLDTDELRAQVRVLLPGNQLADRIEDLVKASRKLLARAGDTHSGLVYGLLHLFNGVDQVAASLRSAALAYTHCQTSSNCAISSRDALNNKTLKSVALLSSQDWNTKFVTALPKRLDGMLEWKVVLGRFAERGVIGNIFNAFDRDSNGVIPYSADSDDLREATDIAYTILSIVSSTPDAPAGQETTPLYIKPSAVVGAVGLVADGWVMPANRDGKINLDEFYGAVKVYEDISAISQSSSLGLQLYTANFETAVRPNPALGETFFVNRPEFIKNIGTAYKSELPYLNPVFKELDQSNGGAKALLNLIVPKNDKTLDVYKFGTTSSMVKLVSPIKREETLSTVAVLVLFDRLIIKCDANEDEHFDWKELDCVAPLALEAGKQLFTSGVIEFPPFVADAGAVGLDSLSKKGLPLTIAKTVLLNGSTSKVRLSEKFMDRVKNGTSAGLGDVASLFESLEDIENEDFRGQIGAAVTYSNSFFRGFWNMNGNPTSQDIVHGVSEWDSLASTIIYEGIFKKLPAKTFGLVSSDSAEEIWERLGNPKDSELGRVAALKTLVPLAFVLGCHPTDYYGHVFKGTAPISPANLLSVLESLISEE